MTTNNDSLRARRSKKKKTAQPINIFNGNDKAASELSGAISGLKDMVETMSGANSEMSKMMADMIDKQTQMITYGTM
jgi:hypothetical protein